MQGGVKTVNKNGILQILKRTLDVRGVNGVGVRGEDEADERTYKMEKLG